MANLLDLAILGGGITLFAGQVVDSSKGIERKSLTTKEVWGSALLLGVGAILSIQDRSPIPLILMALIAGVFIYFQERTFKSANQPEGKIIPMPIRNLQ